MSNAAMSPDAMKILSEVLALSSSDRAAIVEELVSTLEPDDQTILTLRLQEARERWAAYKAGRMEVISLDELFEELDRP